jgi:hypothetical protein
MINTLASYIKVFFGKAKLGAKIGPPDGQKSFFGKLIPIWDGRHAYVPIMPIDIQVFGSWYANCLIPIVRSDTETHGDGQTNSIFTQT